VPKAAGGVDSGFPQYVTAADPIDGIKRKPFIGFCGTAVSAQIVSPWNGMLCASSAAGSEHQQLI